jgi:hypothetical protein
MELIEVEVTEDDPIFKEPVRSFSPPWFHRSPAVTASTDQPPRRTYFTWEELVAYGVFPASGAASKK